MNIHITARITLLITICCFFTSNSHIQTLTPITELSFALKPSSLGGGSVGWFALHNIAAGTSVILPDDFKTRELNPKDIPAELRKYCVMLSDEICLAPERFNRMENLWYINHSDTPNVTRAAPRVCVTLKDIAQGEELTMNFNQFEEPEHLKEGYNKPAEQSKKSPLIVFAQITPKSEFFDDAKNAILNIIPQTLAEPGCRMFTLHESKDKNDHSLYLYEIWDNASDLESHYAQEYTKAVFTAYQEWLEKPVTIIKLDKVS